MKVFCGTSGWAYDWNEGRSLDWFVKNSGLNALELNMSFYRFPFPNQIKGWARKGNELRWAIKVNRLVTHQRKFDERALGIWRGFEGRFEPMEELIDFYLFQLPPSFTPKSIEKLERFIRATELGGRFALEVRNSEWFKSECIGWAKELGITWVSVDSPEFPREVYNTGGFVYERMHGRTAWYSHDYTEEEIHEIAKKIISEKPESAYVFLNTDHYMLSNSRAMMRILTKLLCESSK